MKCQRHFFTVRFYQNNYEKLNAEERKINSRTMNHLIDSLKGLETIKIYNAYITNRKKVQEEVLDLQNTVCHLGQVENEQAVKKALIGGIGEIIILGVGAFDVIHGVITLGDLITYNIIIGYILSSIRDIINLQPNIQAARVAVNRLNTIFEYELEDLKGEVIDDISDITMDNISFRYDNCEYILHNLNFNIKKGEKIGILGENGSGKTTFAKLLLKLYNPSNGTYMINETDVNNISSYCIREKICYVSQDDMIFSASIEDNILMGREIERDEINKIIDIVELNDFIKNKGRGIDFLVEEGGSNLSKGQKQKIALARALLHRPDLLILDEATSNLDHESEVNILNKILKQSELTLIIISHTLEIMDLIDKKYDLRQGKLFALKKKEEVTS